MVQTEIEHRSFLIYKDHYPLVECLEDEEAGVLFKALFKYACNGERASLEGAIKGTFLLMTKIIDQNDAAYKARCEQNRKNGMKGGRPRKTQKNQTVFQKNRTQAKKADNEKENEKENERDKTAKNRRFSFNDFQQNTYDFEQLEQELQDINRTSAGGADQIGEPSGADLCP